MSGKRASRRFAADNRAVSAVIGFILVFGILILLLTVYQAQIVPQQNAQMEFEHFEDSQNELIELRNSVSTTGQADMSQFPSVTLGTTYQTRLLTINPPPPSGTLQTSEEYNITISNGTTEYDKNITTRFLEYQPGYNEIIIGPTRFEHSLLYLDERERGNNVSIIEEQNIVKNGKVRITALQNQYQATGTQRVTLELYPQDDLTGDDFPDPEGENLTVTIPTRLDEDQYWDDALDDSNGIYQGVDPGSDVDKLNLSVDLSNLEVNTVGIREEPAEGPAKNILPQAGGGGQGGGGGGSGDSPLDYRELDTANDGDLEFSVVNIAGETITVTGFGVDATELANNVNNVNNPRINNGDDNEVEIEPDDGPIGFANRDGGGGPNAWYEADGTLYDLDDSANIENNEEAAIIIEGIRSENDDRIDFDLVRTANAANADVTVTLQFSSYDNQEFYFEDIS